jgi:glycerol-3-phosphate dehydrogenase
MINGTASCCRKEGPRLATNFREMPGQADSGAQRRRDLESLAGERWDVLVVGGGITGCGILLDAASRGLRTALVEKDDFATGTSSRSSRLIHGGLRYLEQFQIGLVREALRERARLLRLAPHLVRLEPFVFPVYGGLWARPFYGAGLTMYDLLGASHDGGFHRWLSARDAVEAVPGLRRKGLRGAFIYHDGQEDDARYVVAVMRTAQAKGGVAASRVRALRAVEAGGRIEGCVARDELTGTELEIRAGHVIDATGVWSGAADGPFPDSQGSAIQPSRGTHIVVKRDRIPSRYGMTLRIPHRVCFLVPWPDRWVIGTTDVEDHGSVERPAPSLAEIDEILDNVNRTLDVGLTRGDVLSAYTGIRPLAADPGGAPGSTVKASREHRIRTNANGLVRIGGGKFTTYRLMAAQTVDAALGPNTTRARPSVTAELPLVGAAAPSELETLTATIAQRPGLDRAGAEHLVRRYGTEAPDVVSLGAELDLLRPLSPELPHLEAEVAWAVRREAALDVEDVMARRTRAALDLADRGAAMAPRVAAIMAAELGWPKGEAESRVGAFLTSAHEEFDVPGGA